MNRFVVFWIRCDVALTTLTPSSRGGFNRSVTCILTEVSPGPYHILIDHWTRSSSSPQMMIYGTTLLGPVEYLCVAVFEL